MYGRLRGLAIWTAAVSAATLGAERAAALARLRVVDVKEKLDDFAVIPLSSHSPDDASDPHEPPHGGRASFAEMNGQVSRKFQDALTEHHRFFGSGYNASLSDTSTWGKWQNARAPSAVIATRFIKDTQYMGYIQVGGGVPADDHQPAADPVRIRVVFDTGSTNCWVSGIKCTTGACDGLQKRNRSGHSLLYDPERSATSNPTWRLLHPQWNNSEHNISLLEDEEALYEPYPVHIKFGTGEISGTTQRDTIHFGPVKVTGQVFGMIEKEKGDVFNYLTEFGGIVGLGFAEMAAGGYTPLFDRAMQLNSFKGHNQFSFYFGNQHQPSAFMVGGLPKQLRTGFPQVARVFRPHYWSMKLHGFSIDNGKEKKSFDVGDVTQIIVDSGTSGLTAPREQLEQILDFIPARKCSDVSSMGKMTFTVLHDPNRPPEEEGNKVDLVLDPDEYMVGSHGRSRCTPVFWNIEVPHPQGPAFILGNHFMRHKTVIFNREGKDYPAHMVFFDVEHDNPHLQSWVESLDDSEDSDDLDAMRSGTNASENATFARHRYTRRLSKKGKDHEDNEEASYLQRLQKMF